MADKFHPVKVNLVEEEGWERWDQGGQLETWASNSAWDEYRVMTEDDCKSLVDDLIASSFPKSQWKKIGDEDLEKICSQLKEDWEEEDLKSTHHAIVDAMTWAWEEAYTPSDSDIEDAVDKMVDHYEFEHLEGEHWQRVIGQLERPGVKEWKPGAKKWNQAKAFGSLLETVRYERKPDWYDRYLIFDFGQAEVVRDALEAARKEGAEEEAAEAIGRDFESLQIEYLNQFFRLLEREFQNVDISNRVNFRKYWAIMRSDKREMKAVGQEIKKFLKMKSGPKEWSPRSE